MVDLVPREVHREKRKKRGRVGELKNHQEASIRTCSIPLILGKRIVGTRMGGKMMIKKEEDTQAQAEDLAALL